MMSPAFMVVLLFVTVAQLTRTSPLLDCQQYTVSSVKIHDLHMMWDTSIQCND